METTVNVGIFGPKKFLKMMLTFGKEPVAEWAHHQAYKAREHTSPQEEGWKLRGMPWSHVGRKMRPYPGCDRGRGSVRSAATAVHQAMKLLPGPGKPEGKKKMKQKPKKTALQIKRFLTFNESRNIQWRLKGTCLQRARQYSLIALVDRSILKTQSNI